MSRSIVVSDVPLAPLDPDSPNDLLVMSVPPGTFGNAHTVNVQQLTDSVGVAAPSFCKYKTCKSNNAPRSNPLYYPIRF